MILEPKLNKQKKRVELYLEHAKKGTRRKVLRGAPIPDHVSKYSFPETLWLRIRSLMNGGNHVVFIHEQKEYLITYNK